MAQSWGCYVASVRRVPCVLSVFAYPYCVAVAVSLTAFQNRANTRNLLRINLKFLLQTKDFVPERTEIGENYWAFIFTCRIVINIEILWIIVDGFKLKDWLLIHSCYKRSAKLTASENLKILLPNIRYVYTKSTYGKHSVLRTYICINSMCSRTSLHDIECGFVASSSNT
jgi:hypothetical protein